LSNEQLAQFSGQSYLNLETFRKSGAGVMTPVWFVEAEGVLYVRTVADSGKVKRIRNNSRVRVVPCRSRGEPLGEWIEAQAQLVEGARHEEVNRLLKRKYGLMKTMFDGMGRFSKTDYATIAIQI
jgi:PPOX class probable F420-dependent enzyme